MQFTADGRYVNFPTRQQIFSDENPRFFNRQNVKYIHNIRYDVFNLSQFR